MTDAEIVEQARHAIGPVGALLLNVPFAPQPTLDAQRRAVRRLETAGYPTVWTNEGVGGKDGFVQLAILLAATERLTFASGVLNMFARPPQTAHGAAAYLADAFPGRFVLGLGVGFPFQADAVGEEYGKPTVRARDYLARMSAEQPITPNLEAPFATILAANGPRMLAVAREAADGALPAVQPAEFTRAARGILGPDRLLAVGVPFVLDRDRESARPAAREFLRRVAGVDGSPYAANLRRLGYTAEDLADVSDHLLEATVAFGTPDDIAAHVRAHLDAGADHVRLDAAVGDLATSLDQLERLAPALPSVSAAAK
jgi:probable F420-dependent oxidoreductase